MEKTTTATWKHGECEKLEKIGISDKKSQKTIK
jgi:hypothetical protein